MSVFSRNCEDCRRRREAMIAAGKRMAEWVKRPFVGTPPLDLSQKPQVPAAPLPSAAPPSQPAPTQKSDSGVRLDPRGRVRE